MSVNPFLVTSPIFDRVLNAFPDNVPAYLVGGAVRDALLGKVTHDLDFVLPQNALAIGRQVANSLGGAFYPLDQVRQIGRVIFTEVDHQRYVIDFALQRGPDLETDLRDRDFTINAMAVDVTQPEVLIDPMNGAADLLAKKLRACSADSMRNDPLRLMRGVRLALGYRLNIVPETRRQMRAAAPGLAWISQERIRDELFRILDGPQPAAAIRALDILDGLSYVLPELADLKGIEQSPPHVSDTWNHSLNVLQKLDEVLEILAPQVDPDISAGLILGLVSLRLGRYREKLNAHLEQRLNPDRSLRQLLLFSALYHDVGKPGKYKKEGTGRIRFIGHDLEGVEMVSYRAQELRLSVIEIDRLETIVRHHMRPMLLRQSGKAPSRRAVYRFFRDCGDAGVDVCALSIADVLAVYGNTLPLDLWQEHLDVIRRLLETWWEKSADRIMPPSLVNGDDIIQAFDLSPGPKVGQILEAIREAQAIGQVRTRDEALAVARSFLRLYNDRVQGKRVSKTG